MLHAEPEDRAPDPLAWLAPILWPDGRTRLVATGDAGRPAATGGAARRRPRSTAAGWWGSPEAGAPRILIPAGAPRAARRAVRRYHDGFTPGRRLKSLVAEATMLVPAVASATLRRHHVRIETDPGAARGVVEWLGELLDEPDLVVAVSLSIPKSNRKPVLQLLTADGICLGWAKVAWSPISEALVANEAHWLTRPAVAPLLTPELLHDVELCGRRVVVASPVDVARRPRRRPDAPPAPTILRAVAGRGSTGRVRLVESAWWQSVDAVRADATDAEWTAITATATAVGDRRLEVGAWHGDLTPWNLMTTRRGVQLIDWELAADGVPVGFDLCHFHTQVGAEMRGATPAAALDRSARLSPQGLAELGIDPAERGLVWRLYLVELVRRAIALRTAGYPTERLTSGPAALDRLSAMARREAAPGPVTSTTTSTTTEAVER
ncbi:MAG: phosphotransferase [Actinomycetota bacterium]